MPQFSDDLYLGTAVGYMGTNANVGDNENPSPMSLGVGPLGRIYTYDAVPAAPALNNIALSQTPASAGNLTLTAGAGVTQTTNSMGQTIYSLDYARGVQITGTTGTVSEVFTVYGYDIYGQAMTEAITGPTGATTVFGKKAFKSIYQIAVAAGTTGAVEVGTSDVFGLPVAVMDAGYIVNVGWNGALAKDTGTFVPAVTTTATSTTGDVRGTYTPSTTATGTARLVVTIAVTGIQAGPNATRAGAFGVTQA